MDVIETIAKLRQMTAGRDLVWSRYGDLLTSEHKAVELKIDISLEMDVQQSNYKQYAVHVPKGHVTVSGITLSESYSETSGLVEQVLEQIRRDNETELSKALLVLFGDA